MQKIYRLKDKVVDKTGYSKDLETIIHKTIKKVSNDLTTLSYNTAVSAIMILTNEYDKKEEITRDDYRVLLTLLNPIAPHITEELNESIGFRPICNSVWPKYDSKKVEDTKKTIGVQVNGKLRGTIEVNVTDSKEVVEAKAKELENVQNFINGKEIVKIIIVPNKIVNIVVK